MKLAIVLMLALAASAADAAEFRCHATATREIHCDSGARIHRFGGVETIQRPGKRDVRCWSGPTGVACSDR